MPKMPKICFRTSATDDESKANESPANFLECPVDSTIFEVAQANGVAVETACVGRGTCGLCRVEILEGEDALSPFTDTETKHLGNVYFITHERLSCQCRIKDPDSRVVVAVRGKT